MKHESIVSYVNQRHLDPTLIDQMTDFLTPLEAHLIAEKISSSIEALDEDGLDRLIARMVQEKKHELIHFHYLMRYMIAVNRRDLFVHLTKYTGGHGVIESILAKLERVVGKERSATIIEETGIPKLGTPLDLIGYFTETFVNKLKNHLSKKEFDLVLADNHHQIPRSAFSDEKIRYEAADSLEAYLKDLHERKVKELEDHYHQGKVWFEQIITPEVIDFVKTNQEILSAVYKDNALFITKIPYDTKAFLEAKTDKEKRYYSCHCPFARTSIIKENPKIDGDWCMCSAGFTKYPFDILFDTELPIECLSSALKGDELCRFRIPLDGINILPSSTKGHL